MKDITLLVEKLNSLSAEDRTDSIFFTILENIARFYIENLELHGNEVAILLTNKDKSVLSFAFPDYLINAGIIPVSSPDAFASQIYKLGRGFIENNFNQVKHLHLFEFIRHSEHKPLPIWKMMGAVIRVGDDKIGVIEISRKGASLQESGDDFTQENLEMLIHTMEMLAPFIKRAMPEDYRGKLS